MSIKILYFKLSSFKVLSFILSMLLLPLSMVASYSNKIIDIKEISGKTKDSVILTFDKPNPIVVLTPASFTESQENIIQRYFMPNTTISESLETDHSDNIFQNDLGVELVMHGKFVRKIALLTNKIFIQAERLQ